MLSYIEQAMPQQSETGTAGQVECGFESRHWVIDLPPSRTPTSSPYNNVFVWQTTCPSSRN